MTDIAIRVENPSKLYPSTEFTLSVDEVLRTGYIGAAQKRHDTLRDQIGANMFLLATDP